MRTLILGGIILALAQQESPRQTATADAPSALTLPSGVVRAADDKARNPALDGDWVEKTIDDAGLRIQVSYPSAWRLDNPPGPLLRVMGLRSANRFGVVMLLPAKRAPMSLNENIPAEKCVRSLRS
jgi:hypothetical protein